MRWQVPGVARTLLVLNGAQQLLIAAGPQGLAAFDAATGTLAWSLTAPPPNASPTLTPLQFYQAAIAHTNNVIYATGIAWDTQRVQEQLWLYALDAPTGNVR